MDTRPCAPTVRRAPDAGIIRLPIVPDDGEDDRFVAEVGQHEAWTRECPSAGTDGDVDAGVAEADDVGAAVAGDVGEQAWVLVDAPAAGLVAEVVEDELGGREGAVAVAERDVDAGVAEADDVGAPVAGDVGQEAWVFVDLPAAGVEAEVVEHGDGLELEAAVAVAECDVDAGVAEADDVGAAVAGDVGEQAWVLVGAPAAGLVAEVVEDELGGREGAVAVAERDVDAGVAEADDVGAPVAGDVGQEAWVFVDLPAAGVEAEVVEHGDGLELEAAVAVAECDVDAGVAEADDVGAAVAGDVGEQAWVLVGAPAAGLVAEVVEDELGGREGAVAVAERDVDAGVAEADDVGAPVAGDVGQEAWVAVDAPATRLDAEIRQDDARLGERPVAVAQRGPDAGFAEAHDVGTSVARNVGQETRAVLHEPAGGIRRHRDRHNAVAADRARYTKLPRCRLGPCDLLERRAAVLRHPDVARQRPGEDEHPVVRTCERQHAAARELRRGLQRSVREGRTNVLDGRHERLLCCGAGPWGCYVSPEGAARPWWDH